MRVLDDLAEELAGGLRHNLRLIKAFEGAYASARAQGQLAAGIEPEIAAIETAMFFSGLLRLWLLHGPRSALRRNTKAALAEHVRARSAVPLRLPAYGALGEVPQAVVGGVLVGRRQGWGKLNTISMKASTSRRGAPPPGRCAPSVARSPITCTPRSLRVARSTPSFKQPFGVSRDLAARVLGVARPAHA